MINAIESQSSSLSERDFDLCCMVRIQSRGVLSLLDIARLVPWRWDKIPPASSKTNKSLLPTYNPKSLF